MAAQSGMDWMLNAVLKYIGIAPDEARKSIANVQQIVLGAAGKLDNIDARLTRIEQHLGISENGRVLEEKRSLGNGGTS